MMSITVLSFVLAFLMVAFVIEGANASVNSHLNSSQKRQKRYYPLPSGLAKRINQDLGLNNNRCECCPRFKFKCDNVTILEGSGNCTDVKNILKELADDYDEMIRDGCECAESAGFGMPSIGQIGLAFCLFFTIFMTQRLVQYI